MKQFFTTQDFTNIDYVPREKLAVLVQELNRVLKLKVAGVDEQAWTAFVDRYAGTSGGIRRSGDQAAHAQI